MRIFYALVKQGHYIIQARSRKHAVEMLKEKGLLENTLELLSSTEKQKFKPTRLQEELMIKITKGEIK